MQARVNTNPETAIIGHSGGVTFSFIDMAVGDGEVEGAGVGCSVGVG